MASQQPYQLTARTLALSDVIPTQAADGATPVGKNTIQDVIDLVPSSGLITTKVSYSSAALLTFGSAKTLIASPGGSAFIMPINVTYIVNSGSMPYATNTNIALYLGGEIDETSDNPLANTANNTKTFSRYFTSYFINNASNVGSAFFINCPTGNPTSGNGTLDVYVTYCIITL